MRVQRLGLMLSISFSWSIQPRGVSFLSLKVTNCSGKRPY